MCPDCGKNQRYAEKRVRRFFTLYFIPLVPLDVAGEYVECQGCKATFKPSVLEAEGRLQIPSVEAEFHAVVKRVMVLMMLADGHIDPSEIETLDRIYQELAGRPLSRDEIDREVEAVETDARTLEQYLSSVASVLNDVSKETVVRAAHRVASADGKVTEDEASLLCELAAALELSPMSFRGVVR